MDLIKKKKPLAGNLVTLAILCALFVLVLILMEAGALTRHIRSMLVPICINIILAVSLNLTVGFLGELTLGHAGFMSVGAYAGCLFSIAMQDILPTAVRFPLAMLVGGLVAAVYYAQPVGKGMHRRIFAYCKVCGGVLSRVRRADVSVAARRHFLSMMDIDIMRMSLTGRSPASVSAFSIFSTTSIPLTTSPKTV